MSDGARRSVVDAEALRAFRNVCALATITHGCAELIAHPYGAAQWAVRWSDSFLFGYHSPGRGGGIVTLEGAVRGMDTRVTKYRAISSPQVGLPSHFRIFVDRPLLDRLFIAWRRHYVARRQRSVLRRLFRSLEVAFQAGLFPADGLPSLSDVGLSLARWVSAFEILFHPGGEQDVRPGDVRAALRAAPFDDRVLLSPRYKLQRREKFRGIPTKRRRPAVPSVTLAEAIYADLHRARCRFLHGNPIRRSDLYFRQSNRHPFLMNLAPVLYNVALLSFLAGKIPGGPEEPYTTPGEYLRRRDGMGVVQDALLAARSS